MHALAVEISDFLATAVLGFDEELDLFEHQQIAQTIGDTLGSENLAEVLQVWLDEARERLEATKADQDLSA